VSDQHEKPANFSLARTDSHYLNGKRDSVWFECFDMEVTAEPEEIAAQRARMHPLGPDTQDRREAVRTLQNLREELQQGACPLREVP
jgi:hypothetical protein